MSLKPEALRAAIEDACARGGYVLGWRLLYSPVATISRAQVAFIGLNPGGAAIDPDHADLAPISGSAYVGESWRGCPAGESALQRQVRGLFARLDVAPQDVLAGNLVPFRSQDWSSLPDKKGALTFGCAIWRELIAEARPSRIITMGAVTYGQLSGALGGRNERRIACGWGNRTIGVCDVPGARIVGLPHLSRYPIIGRSRGDTALDLAFAATAAQGA